MKKILPLLLAVCSFTTFGKDLNQSESTQTNPFMEKVSLPLIGHGSFSFVDLGDIPGLPNGVYLKNGWLGILESFVTLSPPEFGDREMEKASMNVYAMAINHGVERCDLLAGKVTKILNPKEISMSYSLSRMKTLKAEAIVTCELTYKDILTLSNWNQNSALLSDNSEVQKLGEFGTILEQLTVNKLLDEGTLDIDSLLTLKLAQKANAGELNKMVSFDSSDLKSKFNLVLSQNGKFEFVNIQDKMVQIENGGVVKDNNFEEIYEYAKSID